MQIFNASGFGQTIFLKFQEDLTTFTEREMRLVPTQGRPVICEPSKISLNPDEIVVDNVVIPAFSALRYEIQDGDLKNFKGLWEVRGSAGGPQIRIAGITELFRVIY